MNTTLNSLAGGLAGATVLTAVHETLRKTVKDAPQVQKIGMEAIKKMAGSKAPESEKSLYAVSMAGDLISNSLYYSSAGLSKNPIVAGSLLGLAAGVGVVLIPKYTNLDEKNSSATTKTAWMSFGYYFLTGVLSGVAISLLNKYKSEY